MSELDRREFIAFIGRTCAGATALSGATGAALAEGREAPHEVMDPLGPGARHIFRGRGLTQIAMPMGGLGGGNVALAGRGNLRNWQIFNVCNPNAQLQAAFFAVWARPEGGKSVAKLLQMDPVGKLPTIEDVEFVGEYPFAEVNFLDSTLPVQVRLESYSPFIPLNARDSAIPGVVFRFTVKNTTRTSVAVSLAQTCQNAVGFDGGVSFESAVANTNRVEERDGLHLLQMITRPDATDPTLTQPVIVVTDSRRIASRLRFFQNVEVRFHESLEQAGSDLTPTGAAALAVARGSVPVDAVGTGSVYVAQHAPVVAIVESLEPSGNFTALEAFVQAGGRLLVLGDLQPFLSGALVTDAADSEATVFDDFEGAKYDPAKWTVEGAAFGAGPAHGGFPGQQPVKGYLGAGLVNSFLGGDGPTGKMTSTPFAIKRRYIHFLIGGGSRAGETCFNLRVDGKVVRTATGRDNETLEAQHWDVRDLMGQMGRLEIVDARGDAWGHINVDEIVFSDSPRVGRPVTPEMRRKMRVFLPFAYTDTRDLKQPVALPGDFLGGAGPAAGYGAIHGLPVLPEFKLNSDGRSEATVVDGALARVAWLEGQGRVVFLPAPLENWFAGAKEAPVWRDTLIGRQLAWLTGTEFKPGTGMSASHPRYGSMAIATDAHEVTHKAQWNTLDAFWQDFSEDGRLEASGNEPAPPGETWNGALAAHIALKPGEQKEIVFRLGWHFPNRYRDGSQDVGGGVAAYEVKYRLGNQYNHWFKNAGEVVGYLHANDARLRRETRLYHDTLYDTTLPYVLRDAISSQTSILRSQTSMWIEDGHWMAYEGLGCCPMNCTHVYNYAQALAKLFPELERNVRGVDLTYQLQEDGGVRHRVQLPLEVPRATGPFTDGHLSTICKAYREHLQSPDMAFLKTHWPAIQKATEYALRVYDADATGVVKGRQPNTYDCDVYGTNSFISTQYLAALRAAEEMAKDAGDGAFAGRCAERFAKGSQTLDATCWNGEYYQQIFPDYLTTPTQYGPGCLADQVLGQWWAHVLNLGPILPVERVRSALKAVVKHNFIDDFTSYNLRGQRMFADGRDQGLIICSWPRGGRPEKVVPILYDAEVWTGVEYQVASHLMYEGMVEEGMQIVTALRNRYDGTKRNPWNEIECSDHYGRAMASWSTLLAASGYHYHGPKGILGFAPRIRPEDFRSFFTTAEGWGTFTQQRGEHIKGKRVLQQHSVAVAYGTVRLSQMDFQLPAGAHAGSAAVTIGGRRVPAKLTMDAATGRVDILFATPLMLKAGETLTVRLLPMV